MFKIENAWFVYVLVSVVVVALVAMSEVACNSRGLTAIYTLRGPRCVLTSSILP